VNVSSATWLNAFKTLVASDGAREDRRASAAEARLRDAQTAVETLKRRRSEASEERKALARRKVEQLKARLQALQSMASADPKGTGRLAAQLARELGAAVKAYAAAGGSASGLSAATAPAAPASPTVSGDAATTGEPGAAEVGPDGAGGARSENGEEKADGDPSNPYQQAIDAANAKAVEATRRGEESRADAEFSGEARRMAAQIKSLIRQALEKSSDDASEPAAREAESAMAALERALADADAPGVGVSLLV